MNAWLILVLIPIELAIGLMVIRALLNSVWIPIQTVYPEQTVLVPCFHRNYQSFSFGLINAGFCYHVTVDDNHLHIAPVRPLRWGGQKTASIPWSEIRLHKKQPMLKRYARVLVKKTEIVGPAWCFEMLRIQSQEE
jgi:hypothetical protein